MEKYKKIGIVALALIIVFIIYLVVNSKHNPVVDELANNIEDNLKKENFDVKKSENRYIYSILATNEENEIKFISYNIDLDTGEELTNEELASRFNLTLEDIYSKIEERLQKYYNEELEQGYIDPYECNISCYKSFYRNISDIKNNYTLYVKNNKLYIYISFDDDTMMDDKEYFNNLKYNPYEIEV